MGWGTTIKCNIRYPYKRFKDVKEIENEQKSINWKLKGLWSTVERYVKTNPKDYVSEHSNNQWNTYDATIGSIQKIVNDAREDIDLLLRQDKVLSMMSSAVSDNITYKRAEHKSKFRLGYYGKYHWYTSLVEIIGYHVDDYGTEITDYVYNSREQLYDYNDVSEALEEAENSLAMWWEKLINFAIQNPQSYIQDPTKSDEFDDEFEVCHSYAEVMFYLNKSFEEYKELIEEENWKIAKYKQYLDSWTVAQKYIDFVHEKEQKEQEFKDKQKEVESEYLKSAGYTAENLFKAPNWQELSEGVQNALQEAHLIDSDNPVKWDHEADDEIDYDSIGYIEFD